MTRFHPDRPDDPTNMKLHTSRFFGGRALVVLGGPSGKDWEAVRDRVNPNVIITVNGCTFLPADYWLLVENMNYCENGKRKGNEELARYMQMMTPNNQAETLLISHRSWNLLPIYGVDADKSVCIRRKGYALENIPEDFSFREYGEGFLAGGISQHPEAWKPSVKVRVGTVGLQTLHLAGMLGCAEVHTVGFDLLFRETHHWYEHPKYKADRFRTEQMFVDYKGVNTQLWWLEAADYLKGIEPLMAREGLQWTDHSNGLLKMKGLACAS